MTDPAAPPDGPEVAFESFGVKVALKTNDETAWPALRALVPPHAAPCPVEDAHFRFFLRRLDDGLYDVRNDIREGAPMEDMHPLSWVASNVEREFALGMVDSYVHNTVALRAPLHVFVQGGAVAQGDAAIMLLGKPLTGRTTLVEALVARGLTYLSDEYAVIDAQGRVEPYRRPLPSGAETDQAVDEPRTVAAIVLTGYRPGAQWQPARRSSGEGLLTLMSHVIGGQERPEQTMRALKALIDAGPVILETPRDEADAAAAAVLAELEGARSS
jgi:hypothetical protein